MGVVTNKAEIKYLDPKKQAAAKKAEADAAKKAEAEAEKAETEKGK